MTHCRCAPRNLETPSCDYLDLKTFKSTSNKHMTEMVIFALVGATFSTKAIINDFVGVVCRASIVSFYPPHPDCWPLHVFYTTYTTIGR